jgi:hypothetical protein
VRGPWTGAWGDDDDCLFRNGHDVGQSGNSGSRVYSVHLSLTYHAYREYPVSNVPHDGLLRSSFVRLLFALSARFAAVTKSVTLDQNARQTGT